MNTDHAPARPSRRGSNYPPRPRPPPTIILVLFWIFAITAALLLGWWVVPLLK